MLASTRPSRPTLARPAAAAKPAPAPRRAGAVVARRAPRVASLPPTPTTPLAPPRATSSSPDDAIVEDNTFRIERTSFGSILTPIGVFLLSYGFGAFFGLLPGADVSPIMLVYGFPMSLLGFALYYAQLAPVPCVTTAGALAARDAQATDIQKQLRDDVTRFRYGDEAHLEEALNRVFQFGRATGIPRRAAPTLVGIREELTGPARAYTLVLEFENKKDIMPEDAWTSRLGKIESFFGPGITASLTDTPRGVDVALAVDGSGAGRDGVVQKDLLPPLVPGARPRQDRRGE